MALKAHETPGTHTAEPWYTAQCPPQVLPYAAESFPMPASPLHPAAPPHGPHASLRNLHVAQPQRFMQWSKATIVLGGRRGPKLHQLGHHWGDATAGCPVQH